MKMIVTAATLGMAAMLPQSAAAQAGEPTGHAVFDSAYHAWEAGRYPDALRTLQRLLNGRDADRHLAPAAVLTGELFTARELTADGRLPRWSADGRHVTWESGTGTGRRVHMAAVSGETVATAAGHGAVAAGSTLYFLRVQDTPEIRAARAAVEAAAAAGDNQAAFRGRSELAALEAASTRVMRLENGREAEVPTGDLVVQSLHVSPGDGVLHVLGAPAGDGNTNHLYRIAAGAPVQVTTADGPKADPVWLGGTHLMYSVNRQNFAVQDLATGSVRAVAGMQPRASADGSTIAFVRQQDGRPVLSVMRQDSEPVDVVTGRNVASPAPSPDGSRIAFQVMDREDWEIHVVPADGGEDVRITREIQHDLMPQWVNDSTLLAVMGEARHRRSFLYDVRTGNRTRLFHNNTVRTVAPEYEWYLSPDRTKLLVVAERDGDTVSPERGVYVTDLTRRVTLPELRERVAAQLEAELALRERGAALFAGLEPAVAEAVADVSKDRIYRYELDLYRFGSKHITQPGNARAIEYLTETLRGWGYEPEVQWFEARGVRTANVIAKLPGTVHPDVLYTVSSHFDSVERGPGADDNTSGTAALLEAARVLASRPQPATIHFAFFTGEESGLLGSREYVRRAVERGDRLVGALNNDMIGFANDQRLDNTIRYSNDGIRDIQHAAAFLFTDLITYDAKYYKSTDAHAYYEAYGDIVGGIGSYPILGNPHYHQTHDVLETINHQLIAEVSKTTVATLMHLTNSPSRVTNVRATHNGSRTRIEWDALPEQDVVEYVVEYDDVVVRTRDTHADLPTPVSGGEVRVRAVNRRGGSGWDWARITTD